MPRGQVLKHALVSEKSYALMDQGSYVFVVDLSATKGQIRHAVERQFGVHVARVNTLRRRGKVVRNRRTGSTGRKPDTKRAIVSLAAGDRIELFHEART